MARGQCVDGFRKTAGEQGTPEPPWEPAEARLKLLPKKRREAGTHRSAGESGPVLRGSGAQQSRVRHGDGWDGGS